MAKSTPWRSWRGLSTSMCTAWRCGEERGSLAPRSVAHPREELEERLRARVPGTPSEFVTGSTGVEQGGLEAEVDPAGVGRLEVESPGHPCELPEPTSRNSDRVGTEQLGEGGDVERLLGGDVEGAVHRTEDRQPEG